MNIDPDLSITEQIIEDIVAIDWLYYGVRNYLNNKISWLCLQLTSLFSTLITIDMCTLISHFR